MLNMPGELVTCQLTETVIKKYKKLVKPNDAWVKGHVKLKILTKANHPKPT